MSAAKCETCEIYAEAQKCEVPSCCTWYMDNTVLRGIPVKFCTEYRPIKFLGDNEPGVVPVE